MFLLLSADGKEVSLAVCPSNPQQSSLNPGPTVQIESSGLGVAEVVCALSQALDLSTGELSGHSLRSCLLGMRLGCEIGLTSSDQHDLYYALLLKDAGCSSNASKMFRAFGSDELKAKRDVKTTDWTRTNWQSFQYALKHVSPGRPFLERVKALFRAALTQKKQGWEIVKVRCERGAAMARLMGLSKQTAEGIRSLDEHWDGKGYPDELAGTHIPVLSRVMLVAQTLEVFRVATNPDTALHVLKERNRRWFDPDLVKAAHALNRRQALWTGVDSTDVLSRVIRQEPFGKKLEAGHTTLDSICTAFAQIVDSKSPFTYNHSNGVANASVAIGRMLGLNSERVLFLRHAALLHDIGKLGVANTILEKPARPDPDEWAILRTHPYHTWNILRQIPGFGELSEVAASHHEKLDGTGYFPQPHSTTALARSAYSGGGRHLRRAGREEALSRRATPGRNLQDHEESLDADCISALEHSAIVNDQTYVALENLPEHSA